MPLLEEGRLIAEDRWQFLDDEQSLPLKKNVIVGLRRWRQEECLLKNYQGEVGILLDCAKGESPREIESAMSFFSMVVLRVAGFKDGRAFSAARLLRERYGYRGTIRVRGDVLPDQWLFYHRCGVNSFEMDDSVTEKDWQDAVSEFSHVYQPAADDVTPVMSLRQRRLKGDEK